MNLIIKLEDEKKSQQFADKLAACVNCAAILTFSGVIGAGKTTLIRAFLQQLGVKGAIKSPTFSLVESYSTNTLAIHHFDLYRIADDSELEYIGFRDYFNNALCCIEWPERLNTMIIPCDLKFNISIQGEGRVLTLNSHSVLGDKLLTCLTALK